MHKKKHEMHAAKLRIPTSCHSMALSTMGACLQKSVDLLLVSLVHECSRMVGEGFRS